jgi:hypothetical protein
MILSTDFTDMEQVPTLLSLWLPVNVSVWADIFFFKRTCYFPKLALAHWLVVLFGDSEMGEANPFASKVEFASGLNAVIGAHVSGRQREAGRLCCSLKAAMERDIFELG